MLVLLGERFAKEDAWALRVRGNPPSKGGWGGLI